MKRYELVTEYVTPCGGEKHALREITEIDAESPEAYLAANAGCPIPELSYPAPGEIRAVTGKDGYTVRYLFTEL